MAGKCRSNTAYMVQAAARLAVESEDNVPATLKTHDLEADVEACLAGLQTWEFALVLEQSRL